MEGRRGRYFATRAAKTNVFPRRTGRYAGMTGKRFGQPAANTDFNLFTLDARIDDATWVRITHPWHTWIPCNRLRTFALFQLMGESARGRLRERQRQSSQSASWSMLRRTYEAQDGGKIRPTDLRQRRQPRCRN